VRPRDTDLVPRLSRARGFDRVIVAAALGDSEGDLGAQALRGLMSQSGPGSSDLKCAALLALAKREREKASSDFAAAFTDGDPATRQYALLALAAFGDDTVWDEVADRLAKTLARARRARHVPPTSALMVTYLARHAASQPGRLEKLGELLRRRGASLRDDEREWLLRFWPGVAEVEQNTRDVPPDAEGMHRWIKDDPLFQPIPPDDL